MKYLVVIVAVLALCWFGFTRYLASIRAQAEQVAAASSVASPAQASPPVKTGASVVAKSQPSAAALPTPAAPAKPQTTAPTVTMAAPARPSGQIKIDLLQALGAGNRYHDDAVGLSVTFPEGWAVRDAFRWGDGLRQNTVFLQPATATSANPSMFYKPYTAEEAASLNRSGARALLFEQAQTKEASRLAGIPDYQNVPDSFSFFDVNGSPAMSYFATFTRGDQVMTEHFIRVLGPNGYVMFFTTGKFEDVKAIMPQLKQAATTIKGP